MFFCNSLAFSVIQQMLAIWSLVPLLEHPAWTSGSSGFTYCWSLAWRILSITSIVCSDQIRWVAQSCLTLCNPMNCSTPGPPCSSPTPGVHSNSRPSSRWCHPVISSSVVPFCLQSFPTSGSFPMSQFFTLGGQSIGVSGSASVLPMNTQEIFQWISW